MIRLHSAPVATDLALPMVQVQLACSTEAVFLLEVAPRLAGRFWVPTPCVASVGEALTFVLELSGVGKQVRGVARVDAVASGRLCLRMHTLAADSVHFAIGDDGKEADNVLMPEVWHEKPPRVAEAKTPPHGTDLQALLADATRDEPEQKTAVYSLAQVKLAQSIAAPPAEPWSGGLKPLDKVGDYQLLERLGRGRHTEVYAALHHDRVVALKLTLPEHGVGTAYGTLFLRQARTWKLMEHRAIAQVLDFGEAAGRAYVAMEYVEGRDLATLSRCMRESGGPSRPFALRVVLEVARAIEHVLGRPGDPLALGIRASDVLVSEKGDVKIVDFAVMPGRELLAAGEVLRELLAPVTSPLVERQWGSATELADALALELAAAGPADVGMMVRALCGISLASEKRHLAKAMGEARPGPAPVAAAPRPSAPVPPPRASAPRASAPRPVAAPPAPTAPEPLRRSRLMLVAVVVLAIAAVAAVLLKQALAP